ncbi:MAG TPA: cupin domain-containing protein, partial [Nannocystis sp.]
MSGPVHIDDRRPPHSVFVRHVDRPQWSAPPHAVAHGHAALAFYVGGSAELEQRGRLRIGAGDVHIVPAGEAHRMTRAREVEVWCLGFDVVGLGPELAGLLAPFERVRDGAAAVVAIPAGRQEHLRSLLAELRREAAAPGVAAEPVQRSLLTLALAEVARAAGDHQPAAAPGLVARALRMIEQRCLGPLSLCDVAAALD